MSTVNTETKKKAPTKKKYLETALEKGWNDVVGQKQVTRQKMTEDGQAVIDASGNPVMEMVTVPCLTKIDVIPFGEEPLAEGEKRLTTSYSPPAMDDCFNHAVYYSYVANTALRAYKAACDKLEKANANGGFLPEVEKKAAPSKSLKAKYEAAANKKLADDREAIAQRLFERGAAASIEEARELVGLMG